MNLTMIAAISKDGFLTKGDNPNPGDWTSDEDKAHYHETLNLNNVYLMGVTTYDAAKGKLPPNAQKIVMTHNVSEQPKTANVTFTDKPFPEIIKQFENQTSHILVLGGGNVFHQLLDQKLIDEAYITVEPVVNKSGVMLRPYENYFEDLGFTLVNQKQLNENGTILKHYVLKK